MDNYNKKELISVVIPVYNGERYLEKNINSIRNQTYKDIEIILVNDGSVDRSLEICKRLYKKDKRIVIIDKENSGAGISRNIGIENANGKYITFVDCDDIVEDVLIENMYKTLCKEEADTVVSGFKKVTKHGMIVCGETYQYKKYMGRQITEHLVPHYLGSRPQYSDSMFPVVWSNLYSMDIINENQIKFPSERVIMSEDLCFLIDYFVHACKVVLSCDCDYLYRINEESLSKSYNAEQFNLIKNMYQCLSDKIRKNNLPDNCLERLQKTIFIHTKICIAKEIDSSLHTSKSIIKSICEDDILRKIIKSYPVSKLKVKQRIFVYLLKYKAINILYLFGKMKIM